MECPVCQKELAVEEGKIFETFEVFCSFCLTTLSLKVVLEPMATAADTFATSIDSDVSAEETEGLIEQVPVEEAILDTAEPHSVAKKVLLCLEGEATRELVEALLEPENIHLIHIPSEMEALISADCPKPDIALIDLDLNRKSGIDLCAEMRKNPVFKDSTIIVIGSMFEKNTRYRNQKPVFPGAGDFIDRYFLQKELLGKIMNTKASVPDPEAKENALDGVQEPDHETVDPDVKENAETFEAFKADRFKNGPEDAQELARDLISAMIRCNEAKVEEGIRRGSLYDFLSDEIGDSRRQYETQVSEATRSVSNYFEEILEEKLQERKEAQAGVQSVREVMPLVHDIFNEGSVDESSIIEEEIESPDFPEASLDDFEATALESEPMGEIGDFFPSEDETALEAEHLEANSYELSRQEAVTEIRSSSLNLDARSFFEDEPEGFEATSLVDESMSDTQDFSLVEEATTTALPASEDVIQETGQSEEESQAIKTAKRLARIIVSDIVIYNEKKVEEGLQSGQFFKLLSEEIDEGRQLYHSRVDKNELEGDYLQEALADYVNKKTSASYN